MNSFYEEKELAILGFKGIGKNVKISRHACFYGADRMEIGDNVRIDDFCILSGDIKIGNNVHIAAGVYLFGGHAGIILDDFTGISSRSAIYAESDDYLGEALTNPTIPDRFRKVSGGTVTLEKHVLIGTGCTILPSVTVKIGTAVGSMSLVNKSLPEWGVYIGIPCKKVKDRSKQLCEFEREYLDSLK
ncbi:acyltransferase [Kineothrix sp. MSJ-39]|uniref:acyltransferase n=1 Tax=Kineothrix sp. MSJ-39 TaxID=2841533 RepID=UPI001C123C22|nr:acyltransferase [Kineothrix sp. MSJ-39]MBU5431076.1 acyltransferase [Kineothrix sp. MSJ-39]